MATKKTGKRQRRKKNVAAAKSIKTQFNQGKALNMNGSSVWDKLLYKLMTLNIIQCLFQCVAAFSTV